MSTDDSLLVQRTAGTPIQSCSGCCWFQCLLTPIMKRTSGTCMSFMQPTHPTQLICHTSITNRYVRFGNPYSPHQLGTYPIADSPTSAQEPMPLENSGNMFFMMLGILREQQQCVATHSYAGTCAVLGWYARTYCTRARCANVLMSSVSTAR